MNKNKIDLIKFLAQPYTIEILKAIRKPKRYGDLKLVCKNDRTLTKRIKSLQDLKLIAPVALKEKGKFVNFYQITERGESVLRKVESLKL